MKGNLSAQKALQGCETEMRELEGIKRPSVIPVEGSCSLSGSIVGGTLVGTHACDLPARIAFVNIPVWIKLGLGPQELLPDTSHLTWGASRTFRNLPGTKIFCSVFRESFRQHSASFVRQGRRRFAKQVMPFESRYCTFTQIWLYQKG